MRLINDLKLDFQDVLILPKRSTLKSRKEVSLTRKFVFVNSKIPYEGVPIIAANMSSVSTFEMAKALAVHDISTALHKHYTAEELIDFFKENKAKTPIFYSMGIRDHDYKKFLHVAACTPIQYVCIDVANGYTQTFVSFIKKFREKHPKVTLLAGNVVTGEMTEELILSGVDIVKVGIGSGSACTTRKIAGVGYPQLSAIIECSDAAHGLKGLICSDGGCALPGDVAKAFAGGSDFVMLGGMLAGHAECGGDIVLTPDGQKMEFYGMSSQTAMDKYDGGVANYRAPEGKTVLVPYKGPVEYTIRDVLGGVRSACTYVGAQHLKELSKRTTFVTVNRTHNKIFGE